MLERPWRHVLVAVVAGLAATAAQAQVSTESSASILVFPKVIADGTRDTFIQISNSSNAQTRASCFYVNGRPLDPNLPAGPANPPLWQVTHFDLVLTKQQPTNWVVSRGRPVDATDLRCTFAPPPPHLDCYGAGTDPGSIPAVVGGFTGHLTCIEVDAAGSPISGNHLYGEATITDLSDGDFSKYSAVGVEGLETNDGDGDLVLGQEYGACPEEWLLGHETEGAEVPSIGAGSSFRTDLTVVPCNQDFDNLLPGTVTLQFQISNEFEQLFSVSTSVTCWADFSLSQVNPLFSSLGTLTAQSVIRPSAGSGGLLLVADELRSSGGATPTVASAAANAFAEGARSSPDLVRISIP